LYYRYNQGDHNCRGRSLILHILGEHRAERRAHKAYSWR
jgi:hypothetical protein